MESESAKLDRTLGKTGKFSKQLRNKLINEGGLEKAAANKVMRTIRKGSHRSNLANTMHT